MRIISTESPKVLSKLIKYFLKTKSSHIAFIFDEKWVVHSNLIGVNIRLLEPWLKHNKIKVNASIRYNLTLLQEEQIFQSLIEKTSEDDYDYLGFLYFAWRGILYRWFNIPLPKQNAWGKSNAYLCTEMVSQLPNWLTNLDPNLDLGMITPDNLIKILQGATNEIH